MKKVEFVMIGVINTQILRDDVEAKVIFERAKEALRRFRTNPFANEVGDTFEFKTSDGTDAAIKLSQLQMVAMMEAVCPKWFDDFVIEEKRRQNTINRQAEEA